MNAHPLNMHVQLTSLLITSEFQYLITPNTYIDAFSADEGVFNVYFYSEKQAWTVCMFYGVYTSGHIA